MQPQDYEGDTEHTGKGSTEKSPLPAGSSDQKAYEHERQAFSEVMRGTEEPIKSTSDLERIPP